MSLVPVEFIGRARAWRTHATANHASTCATMQRLAVSLRGQRRLGQVPSPGAYARVASLWTAQLPAAGRLAITTTPTRRSLRIEEIRAMPTSFRFSDWADDEMETTIVISRTTLIVSPDEFSFETRPVATIPLHALARRYQRSIDNSDASIRADLFTLSTTPESVFRAGGDFNIPTRDDGKWIGTVTEIDDRGDPWLILAVRTFYSADMSVRSDNDMTASATA